jgi:hypothetical protein
MEYLHSDTLGEIIKYMFIKEIGQFAQVSQKYYTITHNYSWVHFKQYLTPENTKYLTINSFTQAYPLDVINAHPRDRRIHFIEEGHLYFIYDEDGSVSELNRISVTTLIHHCFPQFDADGCIMKMMRSKNWRNSKYYGMEPEQIKLKWKTDGENSAKAGTYGHFNVELVLNGIKVIDNSIRHRYFVAFWDDFKEKYPQFKPYRTEQTVFYENFGKNNVNLCGSIDFLLEDDDGNILVLDWKFCKEIKKNNRYEKGLVPFEHMDNCNYSHYSLQLNIYRHILETKYDKNVIFMMLVVFHENNDTYQCIEVPHIELSDVWDTL